MMGSTLEKHVEDPLIWPETVETRLYQKNIAEKALHKNTMVILPTALGKTVISTLAASYFLYNHWDMKILVMAPTRPLVLQHKETFTNLLRIKKENLLVLTGKVPPGYRKHLWEGEAKVYFATPQVVRNDLESGGLSLKEFSFVVFDECHRARKNYAYTLVAKRYVEQAPWPIIMATTASPGSNKMKIQQTCSDLYMEQIEFRTEDSPDVRPYVNKIEVEWKLVDLTEEYKELASILRKILFSRIRRLHYMGLIRKQIKYVTRKDLLYVGDKLRKQLEEDAETEKGPIYGAIVLQAASLTTFHALELLETQGVQPLRRFLERVEKQSNQKKSYRNIVLDPNYNTLRECLSKHICLVHPKVKALKAELSSHIGRHPSTRILVFTQYRDTASHIVSELSGLTGVRAKRFVGQTNKENDPGLRQDEQAQMLRDFREGALNVLVATSVAEEGLDIPNVDLVIFYEPVPSEIRYIQRKGRTGRKSFGKTLILAAKDTSDIAYLYASRRRVEKMKAIVSNLNKKLGVIIRRGVKPSPKIIPQSDISRHKSVHSVNRSTEREVEEFREFAKEVDRAAKRLWMKVMKAGKKGGLVENLLEEEAREGHSQSVVKAAIDSLVRADQVYRVDCNRVASVASISNPKEMEERDVFRVEIERVFPGKAVCLVNDKWRARLSPQEYEGPPSLIKKRMSFKARGILYHEGETLCIHVQRVTEIL